MIDQSPLVKSPEYLCPLDLMEEIRDFNRLLFISSSFKLFIKMLSQS